MKVRTWFGRIEEKGCEIDDGQQVAGRAGRMAIVATRYGTGFGERGFSRDWALRGGSRGELDLSGDTTVLVQLSHHGAERNKIPEPGTAGPALLGGESSGARFPSDHAPHFSQWFQRSRPISLVLSITPLQIVQCRISSDIRTSFRRNESRSACSHGASAIHRTSQASPTVPRDMLAVNPHESAGAFDLTATTRVCPECRDGAGSKAIKGSLTMAGRPRRMARTIGTSTSGRNR